jgi:hypothetical protein
LRIAVGCLDLIARDLRIGFRLFCCFLGVLKGNVGVLTINGSVWIRSFCCGWC